MRLRLIREGIWQVWGICNSRGEDPISSFDPSEAELIRILALLDQITANERGPAVLPDNRNHAVCDNPKILQLTVHPARLLYVFDGQKVIVLCHVFEKKGGKTQKTRASDVEVAVRRLNEYRAAKAAGQIERDTGESDGND